MNLLSLTVCAMFLCFARSCQADTAAVMRYLATEHKDDFARLIERANRMQNSLGSCRYPAQTSVTGNCGWRDKNIIDSCSPEIVEVPTIPPVRPFPTAPTVPPVLPSPTAPPVRPSPTAPPVRPFPTAPTAPKATTAPAMRTLTITVDDQIRLFIDGQKISSKRLPHANNWPEADSVPLPGNAKLIAVRGVNTYGDAGVLASTQDGYVLTNSSWKCLNKEPKGWHLIGFDDSRWPNAYTVMSYKRKPVKGIREDAYWIWTRGYRYHNRGSGDKTVICRLKLQR